MLEQVTQEKQTLKLEITELKIQIQATRNEFTERGNEVNYNKLLIYIIFRLSVNLSTIIRKRWSFLKLRRS